MTCKSVNVNENVFGSARMNLIGRRNLIVFKNHEFTLVDDSDCFKLFLIHIMVKF